MKNMLIAFGSGLALAGVFALVVARSSRKAEPAAAEKVVIAQVEEPSTEKVEAAVKDPAPVTPFVIPSQPVAPAVRTERKPAPKPVAATPKPDVIEIKLPRPTVTLPPVETAKLPDEVRAPAPVDPQAKPDAKPPIPAEEVKKPEVAVEIAPPPPPAPKRREPQTITIPAGTQVAIRLSESLSTESIQTGDTFNAVLADPLIYNGLVIAERGARASGKVVESTKSGRVKGTARLVLELTEFQSSDGQRVILQTESFTREGDSSVKSDTAKVAAGAAIGAALGAIFGGGKGAAIGAASGGAAGGGVVLATRGKPAVLEVETRIPFQFRTAVTLTEKLKN
jgi:hypothetical protein